MYVITLRVVQPPRVATQKWSSNTHIHTYKPVFKYLVGEQLTPLPFSKETQQKS